MSSSPLDINPEKNTIRDMAPSSPNLKRFDVVEVHWVDSEQDRDWTDFSSYESRTPPTIVSVGVLYEDMEDRIILFQSMDVTVMSRGNGVFDSILNIPKCAIQDIAVIRYHNDTSTHEKTSPEKGAEKRRSAPKK